MGLIDFYLYNHLFISNTKGSGMDSSKNVSVIPKWTNNLNVTVLLTLECSNLKLATKKEKQL